MTAMNITTSYVLALLSRQVRAGDAQGDQDTNGIVTVSFGQSPLHMKQ